MLSYINDYEMKQFIYKNIDKFTDENVPHLDSIENQRFFEVLSFLFYRIR